MDANLRPDLSRILPRPAIHRAGVQAFRGAASATGSFDRVDYVLAFGRRIVPRPEDAGYGLYQAKVAATRLNRRLDGASPPPGLFAPDPERAHRLLS